MRSVKLVFRHMLKASRGSRPTSTDAGMSQPDPGIIKRFQDQFQAGLGDAASQPTPVVCQFQQLLPASAGCTGNDCYSGTSCEGSANIGWCYVAGAQNTGGCPQAIKFGGSGPPAGTTIDLECIEQSGGGVTGDSGGGGG